MTTTIRTAFRRIEADTFGFTVTCTVSGVTLDVALTPDERRTLAAALDPRPSGGQWTRDDLPAPVDLYGFFQGAVYGRSVTARLAAAVDAVVEHLNHHHPKTDRVTLQMVAQAGQWKRERDAAVARAESAERQRDDAHTAYEKAARERDEAVARAEAHAKGATRANLDRDKAYTELTDMANRAEKAEQYAEAVSDSNRDNAARAEKAERDRDEAEKAWREQCDRACNAERERDDAWHERDRNAERSAQLLAERHEWKARAEKAEARTAPAVTHDEVEKAIRAEFHDEGFDHKSPVEYAVIRVVCEMFGVDAEATVDPVEAKAEELFNVARPSTHVTWGDLAGEARSHYRAIAAHVLGQEAISDDL